VKVRIDCDEDTMWHALVMALRQREIDVVTAFEAAMTAETGERQRAFAAAQGRAIYSFNVPHFCRLHAEWLARQRTHAGIVLARQRQFSIGEQIRRIAKLMGTLSTEEMQNRLEFLGDWGPEV
jgi:hypothetical protein